MKLTLFPSIVLVLLTSLQVGAQSIDQHGRKIPAITAEVQSQLTNLESNLDNKVSKDYSITIVNDNYYIDGNFLADLYAVDNNWGWGMFLYLPLISSLPNGGKAIITISDVAGNAYYDSFDVMASGSDTIAGAGYFMIDNNYQTITLMSVPEFNMWIIK